MGAPIAAAIVAMLASGFARGNEAHVPFLSFAAANLLLFGVAVAECVRTQVLKKPVIWCFAVAGFAYILIAALV